MKTNANMTSQENEAGQQCIRGDNLSNRQHCSVYLITYSQADEQIVLSHESFAVIVVDAYENSDPETQSCVVQWVCSEESQEWLKVRSYVDTKHGIKLDFSSVHANCYSGGKYATKGDKQYFQSPDHPDLKCPKMRKASETRVGNGKKKEQKANKRKRKARLSVFNVSQLVVERGSGTRTKLLVLAKSQKNEGKTDLAEFIANRGYKVVDEALTIGWDIEALSNLQRSQRTRMEILHAVKHQDCTE